MKLLFIIFAFIGLTLTVLAGILWWVYRPPSGKDEPVEFIVPEEAAGFDVGTNLKKQNLIRSVSGFELLTDVFTDGTRAVPGGYRLNRNMNAWQIFNKVKSTPDLLWVTVREGMRKEQIGEILTEKLGWNDSTFKDWNNSYADKPEYAEGVYFPDTYLVPRDETGYQVAARFVNRFNEKMAPLLTQFAAKNIKWTTGVKIASLIQREAAGIEDMPIISGIIWNRLDKGMLLQIDATMQYTLGKQASGSWWGPVDLKEKESDSPYNTYLYKGLPPTPIANPGLAAIQAALNPAQTDCLFYLHDRGRQIHCALTYEEHLRNIREYLP